jgi:hypothetical protein
MARYAITIHADPPLTTRTRTLDAVNQQAAEQIAWAQLREAWTEEDDLFLYRNGHCEDLLAISAWRAAHPYRVEVVET